MTASPTTTEIRSIVLAANLEYGCTQAEVDAGEPILFVGLVPAPGDRNYRRGWLATFCWAVEYADGSFDCALNVDGMFEERYLKRFGVGSGADHARKAFAKMASSAGVRTRIQDGR